MQRTTALVRALDGATSEARIARAEAAQAARAVVLVAPAMGVDAAYYDPLADALAAAGHDVVTLEHRGQGTSSVRARRGVDFGYVDVLRDDWPAAVALGRSIASERGGGRRLVVLGHSLGGQLASLFAAQTPGALDGLALVASCIVDFRGWSGLEGYRLLGQTQTAAALASALGVFPGDRVGFGGRQPPRLIRDWARTCRTGRFLLTGAPVDYESALGAVELDVLSLSFAGDHYAPRAACDLLVQKMPRARVARRVVTPTWTVKKLADAHFRWAREPAAVVPEVARFLSA